MPAYVIAVFLAWQFVAAEGWRRVARTYVGEWAMVWKDVTMGFTVAGIVTVFVPRAFFEALFVGSGGDPSFPEVVACSGSSCSFWRGASARDESGEDHRGPMSQDVARPLLMVRLGTEGAMAVQQRKGHANPDRTIANHDGRDRCTAPGIESRGFP